MPLAPIRRDMEQLLPEAGRKHFLRLRAIALALRVLRLRAIALALRVLRLRAIALALRVLRLRAIALALRVLRLRAIALALRESRDRKKQSNSSNVAWGDKSGKLPTV